MYKRLDFLDLSKGIGILLVIVGHCMTISCVPHLARIIYIAHMPLFFLISGYLFKPIEISRFWQKYKRYVWVYLTMSFLSVFSCVAGTVLFGKSLSNELYCLALAVAGGHGLFPSQQVAFLGEIPALGVGWFICALFWSLLVYNVIVHLFPKSRTQSITSLMLFAISALSQKLFLLPLGIQPGLCGVLFICIGREASRLEIFRGRRQLGQTDVIFLALLLVLAFVKGDFVVMSAGIYNSPIVFIPSSLIFAFLVVYVSQRLCANARMASSVRGG